MELIKGQTKNLLGHSETKHNPIIPESHEMRELDFSKMATTLKQQRGVKLVAVRDAAIFFTDGARSTTSSGPRGVPERFEL